MGYFDIAIIIYINNIEFGTLHATRLLFESHAGSGANVGGMTPGMTKSSSLRARRSSRIKKRHHGSKDMKKRKRTARWAGFRLPRPVRLRPSRPALVPVRMGSFPASAGLSGFSSARAGFLFAAGPRPAGGTQSGSAPVPARSAAPWAGMREHAQRPRPRSIA
jgi:hypothetical protein